jgi:hypothetical protein
MKCYISFSESAGRMTLAVALIAPASTGGPPIRATPPPPDIRFAPIYGTTFFEKKYIEVIRTSRHRSYEPRILQE